jgi:hypothetical protein
MHAIVCALFAFFSHCVTWHIHVHCVHMNVMSPHVHCAHRVGGIGTCLCPLPACPYMQWHVGHRQGIGRVRIQYASHTWRRCPRFLGQGRLGRSTHPPSSPVQNGVLCPFLNAPNVDKPTALALAIAGVAHMGAAALPLLLRWTSMNTGWDPMTRASEGVSLHRRPHAGWEADTPLHEASSGALREGTPLWASPKTLRSRARMAARKAAGLLPAAVTDSDESVDTHRE